MGLPQKRIAWISPDDYLHLEEAALTKHEYLDGVIYDWQGGGPKSMAGGRIAHNQIWMNVMVSCSEADRARTDGISEPQRLGLIDLSHLGLQLDMNEVFEGL
jgi:hypothetical protein